MFGICSNVIRWRMEMLKQQAEETTATVKLSQDLVTVLQIPPRPMTLPIRRICRRKSSRTSARYPVSCFSTVSESTLTSLKLTHSFGWIMKSTWRGGVWCQLWVKSKRPSGARRGTYATVESDPDERRRPTSVLAAGCWDASQGLSVLIH